MDVPQIKDREHLEAWLKTRSREECIAIAHRAAMRVAPMWMGNIQFFDRLGPQGLTQVEFLQYLLLSGVAAVSPKAEIKNLASLNGANYVSRAGIVEATASTDGTQVTLAVTNQEATAAVDAATITVYAIAQSDIVSVVSCAVGAVNYAAFASTDAWEAVWADLQSIRSGSGVLSLTLWDNAALQQAFELTRVSADLVAQGEDWDFWVRWYDAALRGHPMDWKMQEEIALLPSEVWEGDVAGLAAAIAAIELEYAIDATQNGEIIAINPETGKLYLAPDTDLPADIATYANRKLAKAIALFGENSANQYTALAPELKLLADTLADASNLPVEIFDACASVSRRVTARVQNGECPAPETDALIDDFLTRVRDTGADIFGNDKETQKILQKRHGVKGNVAFIESRSIVLSGAGLIATGSEGYLVRAIVLNAEQATNVAISTEERDLASVKLAGRVSRAFGTISKIGAGLVASEKTIEAVDKIRLSPTANQLFKIVLKYLGF